MHFTSLSFTMRFLGTHQYCLLLHMGNQAQIGEGTGPSLPSWEAPELGLHPQQSASRPHALGSLSELSAQDALCQELSQSSDYGAGVLSDTTQLSAACPVDKGLPFSCFWFLL